MASGPIRVGGVRPGSIAGATEFQAFLRGYPQQVIADVRAELDQGADSLVAAIKEHVPENTGKLKSTVRKEAGGSDLSIVVTVGGPETTKVIGTRTYKRAVRLGSGDTQHISKDADGEGVTYDYALGVEYGHKTPRGGHIHAQPFFWPTIAEGKKAIIARLRAGMKRRAKGGS